MNPTLASDPERVLGRLEWTVIRRLDGLLQGDYRTFFQGLGLDFADLRAYQYGDDVRTMDWNATARLREPHVRRFHEDRDLDAWFLVDTSASLDFGSANRLKREVVVELVGTLAQLLCRHGNRIGACLYDGTLARLFPAVAGRKGVLSILSALGASSSRGPSAETNLSVLLEPMAGVLRRRSLIFFVSDFYSLPGWEGPLGILARRHEVLTVRIHDASETELPDLGPLWLEDAETGGQLWIDTHDVHFRRRLALAAGERDAQLSAAFRRAQVDALELSTDEDLARALLGWSARRRYRKSRPGGHAP